MLLVHVARRIRFFLVLPKTAGVVTGYICITVAGGAEIESFWIHLTTIPRHGHVFR
jgi:hypothetical protein